MPATPAPPTPETHDSQAASAAFASRHMLRVVHAGLTQLGLAAPVSAPAHSERVPLADKHAWLAQISQQYGPGTLLRCGCGASQLRDSPLGSALLQHADPAQLLHRWQRLERYLHSAHFIDVQPAAGYARLAHRARGANPPPLEATLTVLGVLGSLLQLACRGEVVLSSDAKQQHVICRWPALEVDANLLQPRTHWFLHWPAHSAPRHEPAQAACATEFSLQHASTALLTQSLLAPRLARLAQQLHLSPRSLQRKLQQHGSSFSALLRQCRHQHAAQLLLQSQTELAEIGFVCGFADQAHFTRSFKRDSGLTPAQFRTLRS